MSGKKLHPGPGPTESIPKNPDVTKYAIVRLQERGYILVDRAILRRRKRLAKMGLGRKAPEPVIKGQAALDCFFKDDADGND